MSRDGQGVDYNKKCVIGCPLMIEAGTSVIFSCFGQYLNLCN